MVDNSSTVLGYSAKAPENCSRHGNDCILLCAPHIILPVSKNPHFQYIWTVNLPHRYMQGIRVGTAETDGMKTHPLAPMERVFCGRRDFSQKANEHVDPSGLSVVPLILRTQENPEWLFHNNGKTAKYCVANPSMHVNSYELCMSAVRAGLGAAVLAKSVVQNELDVSFEPLPPLSRCNAGLIA